MNEKTKKTKKTKKPDQGAEEVASDVTRGGGSPKIQPVLAGLALAAIIVAISLGTFWR